MNEIAMLPTCIINQIAHSGLALATKDIAYKLLPLAHEGQLTLTCSDYLDLCHRPTRNLSAGRRHLSRLKQAQIINYATNKDHIFINFTNWPRPKRNPGVRETAHTRAETTRTRTETAPTRTETGFPEVRETVHTRAETTRRNDASPYIGSLGSLGREGKGGEASEILPAVEKNETLQALALNMLDECNVVKEPEKLAASIPFAELRAITLRWRQDTRIKSPGSLIYRIIHRHESGWDWQLEPLTAREYNHPFIQRYRTDEEIERDEQQLVNAPQEAEPFHSAPAEEPTPPFTECVPKEPSGRKLVTGGEADPEAANAWQDTLAEMQMQMPKSTYTIWVQNMRFVERSPGSAGDLWRISLPDKFAIDWVQNRLSSKLARALSARLQSPVHLQFEVVTGLAAL